MDFIPPAPPLDVNALEEFAERVRIRSASQRFAPEFVQSVNTAVSDATVIPVVETHTFAESNAQFGQPDGPSNLILNEDQSVKAASLVKLIEKISSTKTDVKMIFDFLLTYRTYATPMQLLNLLRERFRCPPPADLEGSGLIQFTTEQTIVRLKVVNIVKHWVERNWYDWVNEENMVESFSAFIDSWERHPYTARMADQVRKSLEKRRQHHGRAEVAVDPTGASDDNRSRVFTIKPPPPEWPLEKKPEKLDIFSISTAELARQLTLIEWDLWEAIKPWEFLNQAWTKKDKEVRAPGIHTLIKHFNFVAAWVATTLVSSEHSKDRTRVLERFIDLASTCKDIANYNAVMEILSGLGNAGAFRLKRTWADISPRHKSVYDELKALMAPERNFFAFREQLKSVNPPTIPYIGIFLTDLIYINDGSKDFTAVQASSGTSTVQLINFNKCRMVAAHIQLVMQYQQAAYNFQLLPLVEEYVLHHTHAWDDDFVYKLSQFVEPRPGSQPERPNIAEAKPVPPVQFQTDPREYISSSLVIEHSLVVAASTKKLIRHLVSVDRFEGLASEIFATYRIFSSASKLLRRFASVIKSAPEESAVVTAPSRIYKVRPKSFVIRRISALLAIWFAHFSSEIFQEQSQPIILDWLTSTFAAFDSQHVTSLAKLLEVHVKRASVGASRPSSPSPKPIIPSNLTMVSSITDFHPLEIARQLALHGFEMVRRISSGDIFDFVKLDASAEPLSLSKGVPASIKRLFEHRERLRDWIRAEVAGKSPKKKLLIFEHLTEVMKYCLDHLDFLLLQELYLHLVSTPFADVWVILNTKMTAEFQKFKDLFNGARDREALRFRLSAIPGNTPSLPPLGWFFDELQAIKKIKGVYTPDGPDESDEELPIGAGLPKTSVVHFSKWRRLANFLKTMDSFKIPYNYAPTAFVLDYVTQMSLAREETPSTSRQARSATVGYGPAPPIASLLGASISLDMDDISSLKSARLLSAPKISDDSHGKSKMRSVSTESSPISKTLARQDTKERLRDPSSSPSKKKTKSISSQSDSKDK